MRKILKEVFYGALHAAGLTGMLLRKNRRAVPVLLYHGVTDRRWPGVLDCEKKHIGAEDFERQLVFLKKNFQVVRLSSYVAALRGGERLPEGCAVITFDDGYANNAEVAFPIMREFGMKGNIFLVYETVDRHNSWHDPAGEPWVRMLTWASVDEMQRSGIVEFGSHTMRHPDLTRTPLDLVRWELFESKKRLEDKLGREMIGFAYPYGAGAFMPEVRRLAREAGYRYDFSIKQGISPWPWDPAAGPLKRILIRGDDYLLDFHLNLTRGKARF